jgi:hypothetical protein
VTAPRRDRTLTIPLHDETSLFQALSLAVSLFYVGAGLAAVAGGILLYLAPTSTGGTQVGLTTRMVF